MGVTVSQVNLTTDNFAVWVQQTNEIIADLAQVCMTANNDANGSVVIGNSYLVGILGVSSTLAANTIRGGNVQSSANLAISSNAIFAQWVQFPSLTTPGTVNVSSNLSLNTTASFLSTGNATVNAVVNSTTYTLANSTISLAIKLPTFAQQSDIATFLHANGSWVKGATGNVSANTQADMYLSFGTATVNGVINSTAAKWSNSTYALTIGPGQILYGGLINTTANVWMNTATSAWWIGNTTVNSTINSTAHVLANSSINMTLNLGQILYAGVINTTANVSLNTATSFLSVGNSTVNAVVNSTAHTWANGTVTLSLKLPTAAQQSGQYFLHANGFWVNGATGNVSANTLTDMYLSFGTSSVNAVVNSTVGKWSNSVSSLTVSLGQILYAGVINTTAQLNMNTATAWLGIGNASTNAVHNATSVAIANTLGTTVYQIDRLTGTPAYLIDSNVHITGALTIDSGITYSQTANAITFGNAQVNASMNAVAVALANSTSSLLITLGQIQYAGGNLVFTSNLYCTGVTPYISIGNNQVNTVVNNQSLYISNSTASMTVNIGAITYAGNLALGNVAIGGGQAAIGTGTTNVLITNTGVTIANSTASMGLIIGTISYAGNLQLSNVDVTGLGGRVNLGNATVNAVVNSTALTLANSSISLKMDLGEILYAGLINTTANVWQNTATAFWSVGNTTVNSYINSTAWSLANASIGMTWTLGALVYPGLINTTANLSMNTLTSTLSVGNSTVNTVHNSTAAIWSNSSAVMTLTLGQLLYAGMINTTANLWMNAATSTLFTGNTTVNSTINSTAHTLANSTVSLALKLPTAAQQASPATFLHANGSWVVSPPPTVSANSLTDMYLSFGTAAVNAMINSTAFGLSNSVINLTMSLGSLLYAGVINTNANVWMNTATSVLTIGNTTVNTVINSTALVCGNSSVNAVHNASTFTLANSTVSFAVQLPTAAQQSGAYYMAANGSWSQIIIPPATVNANTINDIFLSFGTTSTNTFVNGALISVSNSSGVSNLYPTGLQIGASAVNSTAFGTGATVVNNSGIYVGGVAPLYPNQSVPLTVGYTSIPYNAGEQNSGTFTPDPTKGNQQYIAANGAFTIANPIADCAIDILVTNGPAAGTISFSGFSVGSSTGDIYYTTSGYRYLFSLRRINGIATYAWKALQ